MRMNLVENLHPRFRKLVATEAAAREIIDRTEGSSTEEWLELRGQLKLLCRLKKPAVEAAIPRIREVVEGISDKKLRNACLQLAGQYTAVIVREEIGGRNTGTKNRVSDLFTRAEVFLDPNEPAKPRKPRGRYRRVIRTRELESGFFEALREASPSPEAKKFNHEVDDRK